MDSDYDKKIDEIATRTAKIVDKYEAALKFALENQGFTVDFLKNADCRRVIKEIESGREDRFYVNGRHVFTLIFCHDGEIITKMNVEKER